MKRMIAAVLVLAAVLGTLLGVKIYAQRAALLGAAGGSGVVEGTTVRLSSRAGGRITEVLVREGQAVAAGDVVLRLDCVEPQAALAQTQAQLEGARQQAIAAERAAGAASSAAGAARASVQAADAGARAAGVQTDAARRQASRMDAVQTDVSAAQLDQVRTTAEGMQAQADLARAQRRAGSAQAQAAQQQAGAAGAQAAAAEQGIKAAEAAVQRAQLTQDECEVRSPRAGLVQLLPYETGELVGPGATLATVVDLRIVQASFYLPNADLGAARPGGSATVQADAWPDRAFTGTIATVATEAEFTPRNVQTRTDRDRLVYKVTVDVPNEDGALRPGMPVEVRLLGTGD